MGLFVQSRKTRILCTSRRPIDGASIGRRTLHVPRCSLHSAAAINYTQSHTRRDTSLPSHIPSARQTLSLPSTYNASLLLTFSRSEEHTSELQSHVNLVCRLLLEKKKQ